MASAHRQFLSNTTRTNFPKDYDWNTHGGRLRNRRCGRRHRPVSQRCPIHLVLKANRSSLNGGFRTPGSFRLVHQLLERYARKFFVKVEKISVQGDHIHLIVRIARRSLFQGFLRVFPGQIAQQFQVRRFVIFRPVTDTPGGCKITLPKKLWQLRPFTRVVRGRRAFATVMDYVQLNEKEALGKIPYRKSRLRGLTDDERRHLWDG